MVATPEVTEDIYDDLGDFEAEYDYVPGEYPVGIDEDAPYYDWALADGPQTKYEPVKVMQGVRRAMKEIPKTKSTFKGARVYALPKSTALKDEYVEYFGGWPVPDRFADGSSQNGRRFVNPRSPHTHHYTRVSTKCKCGTLIMRHQKSNDLDTFGEPTDHADDCLKQWRLRARARLCEQRRSEGQRVLLFGNSIRSNCGRLGIEKATLNANQRDIGIDVNELQQRAMDLHAYTFARLCHFHTPREVADAFGFVRDTVRRRINNRTEGSAAEISEFRREYGYE